MSSRQTSDRRLLPSIKWPNWTGPYSNIIELTLVGLLLFAIASFIYQLIVWRGWILYNGDAWRLYYPAKAFMFSHLKESQFPLWTPHLFFGFPFFAEAQAGVLYPIHLLLLIFKTTTAYSIATISRYILGGLFMFLFIRRITNNSWAAVISSLVFAYNGYMIAQVIHENVENALIWLPLILFALDKWIIDANRPALISAGICLGVSFLAGYFFISLLVLITATLYYICFSLFVHKDTFGIIDFGYLKRWIGGISTFGLIGVGLACVQLIPNFELAQVSVRSGGLDYDVSTQVSLSPFHLICFIFPKFFGHPSTQGSIWGLWPSNYIDLVFYLGILPFLLILGALLIRRDRYTLFFGLMFLVAFGLALGQFTPLWNLLHNLPVFSMMRNPARFLSMAVTAGAVLAGLGFDRLIYRQAADQVKQKRYLRLIGFGTGVTVFFCIISGWLITTLKPSIMDLGRWFVDQFVYNQSIHAKSSTHYYERVEVYYNQLASFARIDHPFIYLPVILLGLSVLLIFYITRSTGNKKIIGLICIGLIGMDLFLFARDYNYELPPDAYTRKSHHIDVMEQDKTIFRYAVSPLMNSMRNYDPMIFRQDYIQGSSPLQMKRHAEIIEALRPHMMEISQAVTLNPLVNLLNIKYIATYDSIPHAWAKLRSTDGYFYENKTVLPRAFVASESLVLPSARDVLQALTDTTFMPQETVLLEEPGPTWEPHPDATPATARILRYDLSEIEIETDGHGGFLVLTDTYYPGWTAYVDDEETPILRADYLFRAVPIDSGHHIVRFVYAPWSFRIGASVSIATLVLSVSLLLFRRKKTT